MKCLVIHGSPRKGNTYNVTNEVVNTLNKFEDIEYEHIFLKDINIPFCTGCLSCVTNGEDTCPHHEIMKPLIKSMKDADCLIITSPVYILSVSGLLKNFLDHLPFFFHRPYFFNKTAFIITTTAGSGHKEVITYLGNALNYFGYNKIYSLGFRGGDIQKPLPEKTLNKIQNVTSDFYKSVKNQPSSPSLRSIRHYAAWRTFAYLKFCEKDHDYWKKTGLLESDYAKGVPLNPFKKFLAKFYFSFYKHIFGSMN